MDQITTKDQRKGEKIGMKKRILSILLVVCMLLTLLPGNVFAEGAASVTTSDGTTNSYPSMNEALAAAQANEGSTLKLNSDVDTLELSSGTFSLDGSNYTIGSLSVTGSAITVAGSTIKLIGGTYNTITVGSGTVNALLEAGYYYYKADGNVYTPEEGATSITQTVIVAQQLEVASVTTSTGTTTYYDFITAFNAANSNIGSTLKLLKDASAIYEGIYNFLDINNKMTLELNGYTLTLDKYILRTNAETADFTINDSSADKTGKIKSTIELIYNWGGKLTINGGSFEAINNKTTILIDNTNAVTIINGGSFSGSPAFISMNGRSVLYGGTFNSSSFSVRVATGTVNDLLAENYCYYNADGTVFTPAEGATYIQQTVSVGLKPAVASVTTSASTNIFYDFLSAFNYARASENSGSTLKLLKDTSAIYEGVYNFLDINNKMTLDLNGHTLTLDKYILRTNSATADVIINDSSAAGAGKITNVNTIFYNWGGKLTVNAGSFESGDYAVLIENAYGVIPDVTINGGSFKGNVAVKYKSGNVAICGGTYSGTTCAFMTSGTLTDMLAENYCYYNADGTVFTPAASATRITQTVTVDEIDWSKAVTYDDNTKTYTVYSADGLRWVSGISNGTVTAETYKKDPAMPNTANFDGYTVMLAADIDLSGKNWVPIKEFRGTFDGAGHKVSNITINESAFSESNIGFINSLYGKVKNLYVSGSITVAFNIYDAEYDTCAYAGGIAGFMEFDSGLYNCVSDVEVSATTTNGKVYAGGIVGQALQADILNCICTGTVTANTTAIDATSFAGALVGNADGTTITNCYAKDIVTINKDGCIELPIIGSIGSFDASGNLTAAEDCVFSVVGQTIIADDCTLEYGATLKQAMLSWISLQADYGSYVAWTTDTIPTLSAKYFDASAFNFGAWTAQGDGYIRTDSNYGIVQTAEACVNSGSNILPYAKLEEAIVAAQSASGSTVKLLSNITTKQTVQVSSGTFTIDLNGKTWTADLPENSNALLIDGTSNVTLRDSGTGGTFKSNVTFESCENVKLAGGIYKYIKNATGTIGELLADGYGYHVKNDSSDYNDWIDDLSKDNVAYTAVHLVPVKIITQPQDVTIDFATTAKLTVAAQRAEGIDESQEIGYSWFYVDTNGMHNAPGDSAQAASYDLPTDLNAGSYQYFCEVSCVDYNAKSSIITVTVDKADGFINNKSYPTTYTYNTFNINSPLEVQFTFNVPAGNLAFTWYKGSSTDEQYKITGTPCEVGIYTLKVTGEGNDNITAAECTIPVEIKYLQTDVAATKSPDKEWYNLDDVISDIFIKLPTDNDFEFYNSNYDSKTMRVNDYLKDNGNFIDGEHVVKYQIFHHNDLESGLTDFKSIAFNVDATAPTIGTPTYSNNHSFLGWLFHNSKLDVSVPVSDALSGADHISYVLTPEGGTAQAPQIVSVIDGNATFTVNKSFKGEIEVIAFDKAGNACNAVNINKMFIEETKPTLTVDDGTNVFTDSWYTNSQTLHIGAADADSGIKSITYTVDGGSGNTLFEASNSDSDLTQSKDGLTITAVDGEHTYVVTVTDNALNSTETIVTVKQDTVMPTLSGAAAPTGDMVTDATANITFTASEAGSFCYAVLKSGDQAPTVDALQGNDAHSMTADGNNTISLSELEANTGYTLYIAAKDVAGNKTTEVTAVNFTTAKTSIAGATVAVNEDSFTYNGLSQKPVVTVKLGDNTLTADTDYTVSYSNSNGGADNTIKAGTVTVTVASVSNGNYSGTATDTAVYTIKKAILTPIISGTTHKEYDGDTTVDSGLSINLSGIQNSENVTATAAYSFKDKNVGTEKTVNAVGITLTGDNGNYMLSADTASADVGTITARKVAVVILGDSTYVYNGKAEYAHTVSYSTVGGDTVDAVIKYDGTSEKPDDVKLDKGSIIAYSLVAVITDANYELTTTTGITQFTITQATITAKNTGKSLRYTKTAQQTITADDFGITMNGTFSANGDVIDADGVLVGAPNYGDTIKYQLGNGITYNEQNPQTVTIPVTFTSADTNYAPVNVTLTVTLTDKDTVTLELIADKTTDATYGDSVTYTAELDKDHVFLDALQALDGTIKFYFGDAETGELLATENVSSSAKIVSIKLNCDKLTVGNHTVTTVYSGNTDFASTQTVTTTLVAKKAITVKPKDVSITSGDTVPNFELVYNGLVGAETLSTTEAPALECKKDGNTVDGKTAGTYTITWTNEAAAVFKDGTGKVENYEITRSATGTLTVSDKTSEGSSSGGDGTFGGGIATGTITVPIYSDLGEIKVSASVSDTIATVLINEKQLREIASNAENNGTVKVDVSALKVDTVVIPSNVVSAARGASGSTGLEAVLPTGAVMLDNTALGSVENKGDIKISVEEVKAFTLTDEQKKILGTQAGTIGVVDVNIYVNGTKTSTFGNGRINVSVPYTLKDGEKAENITVWFMKDDGTIEPKKGVYNAKTGKVDFTTDHLSQYFIVNFPFMDVAQDAWYYGSVAYAYNNGLFSGTSGSTFSPDMAMTRGMLVTVLWGMEGKLDQDSSSFTDVASGTYYSDAIAWASANGIVDGYGNGKFGPNNSLTREQMATILYHYAMYKKYDTAQGGMTVREFADYDSISNYALPALQWAVNAGIINGSGSKLTPKENATRAQVSTVLMHFRRNIVK